MTRSLRLTAGITERAMFQGKANFLVAQALLNYTETVGSFILPNGKSGERFDVFFSRIGDKYRDLLRRFNKSILKKRHNKRTLVKRHIIYDDLRCGLTHEYTVKRKKFTIYGYAAATTPSDDVINNLKIQINGVQTRS
jgi:hypothetical protein